MCDLGMLLLLPRCRLGFQQDKWIREHSQLAGPFENQDLPNTEQTSLGLLSPVVHSATCILLATDQTCTHQRTGSSTAMANIMDTIMKANQKEREKNEKADKKLKAEHDDLLSRRVVLENSEVKLEDDIEKVSQRIRDSENRRDKDTEEEIARVREKCLKQHESRMKQIQKSTGCDYDATRKKLQKIRDEIASNGAQSIVSLRLSSFCFSCLD